MYLFRVNSTQGIGHLKRCCSLAKALSKLGSDCYFIIDENNQLKTFFSEFPFPFTQIPQGLKQQQDAELTLDLIDKISVKHVIVDSYLLGNEWEAIINRHVYLTVIDDLERVHQANMLIDIRWRGAQQLEAYKTQLPDSCKKVLGPRYIMLDEVYNQPLEQKREHLVFSLGGGGDWIQLFELIETCAKRLPNQQILLVIGPAAINEEVVINLSQDFSNITCIRNPNNLFDIYQKAALFVGALGTSLYELAITKTPALTFCIADNQENNQNDLDALGHFFHVPNLLSFNTDNVSNLIATLLTQTERLILSRSYSSISLDNKGAQRIAEFLVNPPSEHCYTHVSQPNVETIDKLAKTITIRPINDSDINQFLSARSLETNNWRMTITEKIDLVTHYNWWFTNNREIYVIQNDGQPLIYIWHQLVEKELGQFLIGGWFSAGTQELGFAHAQMALKWQIGFCHQQYPDAVWLAVIHKENKFVNLLNKYMGFQSLCENSVFFDQTQSLFKHATTEHFNYVFLPASKSNG